MRDVDDSWPQPGAKLHHSVGTWPLLLDDETESIECTPGSMLKLHAHAWPAGRATVILRLRPQGAETEVSIEEQATAGPGALVPRLAQDPMLSWRNTETLRRLAYLAERREAGMSAAAQTSRSVDFQGLRIEYDERVLTPRPWTAAQSMWAADLIAVAPPGPVLELCSGAGHIGLLAVTLAPRRLVCVDADPVACGYLRRNAGRAGIRVDVREGRMDEALASDERFAVVIADPPWVPTAEVTRFPEDPVTAINGGADGLDLVRSCLDGHRPAPPARRLRPDPGRPRRPGRPPGRAAGRPRRPPPGRGPRVRARRPRPDRPCCGAGTARTDVSRATAYRSISKAPGLPIDQ